MPDSPITRLWFEQTFWTEQFFKPTTELPVDTLREQLYAPQPLVSPPTDPDLLTQWIWGLPFTPKDDTPFTPEFTAFSEQMLNLFTLLLDAYHEIQHKLPNASAVALADFQHHANCLAGGLSDFYTLFFCTPHTSTLNSLFLIYTDGKRDLENLVLLLKHDTTQSPLTHLTTLQALWPSLDKCTGGVLTGLADAVRILRASPDVTLQHARYTLVQQIAQTIFSEYDNPTQHALLEGEHIHYIKGCLSYFSEALGLPNTPDPLMKRFPAVQPYLYPLSIRIQHMLTVENIVNLVVSPLLDSLKTHLSKPYPVFEPWLTYLNTYGTDATFDLSYLIQENAHGLYTTTPYVLEALSLSLMRRLVSSGYLKAEALLQVTLVYEDQTLTIETGPYLASALLTAATADNTQHHTALLTFIRSMNGTEANTLPLFLLRSTLLSEHTLMHHYCQQDPHHYYQTLFEFTNDLAWDARLAEALQQHALHDTTLCTYAMLFFTLTIERGYPRCLTYFLQRTEKYLPILTHAKRTTLLQRIFSHPAHESLQAQLQNGAYSALRDTLSLADLHALIGRAPPVDTSVSTPLPEETAWERTLHALQQNDLMRFYQMTATLPPTDTPPEHVSALCFLFWVNAEIELPELPLSFAILQAMSSVLSDTTDLATTRMLRRMLQHIAWHVQPTLFFYLFCYACFDTKQNNSLPLMLLHELHALLRTVTEPSQKNLSISLSALLFTLQTMSQSNGTQALLTIAEQTNTPIALALPPDETYLDLATPLEPEPLNGNYSAWIETSIDTLTHASWIQWLFLHPEYQLTSSLIVPKALLTHWPDNQHPALCLLLWLQYGHTDTPAFAHYLFQLSHTRQLDTLLQTVSTITHAQAEYLLTVASVLHNPELMQVIMQQLKRFFTTQEISHWPFNPQTPLMSAIRLNENMPYIQSLCHPMQLPDNEPHNFSVLHAALDVGNLEIITFLCQTYPTLCNLFYKPHSLKRHEPGHTPLEWTQNPDFLSVLLTHTARDTLQKNFLHKNTAPCLIDHFMQTHNISLLTQLFDKIKNDPTLTQKIRYQFRQYGLSELLKGLPEKEAPLSFLFAFFERIYFQNDCTAHSVTYKQNPLYFALKSQYRHQLIPFLLDRASPLPFPTQFQVNRQSDTLHYALRRLQAWSPTDILTFKHLLHYGKPHGLTWTPKNTTADALQDFLSHIPVAHQTQLEAVIIDFMGPIEQPAKRQRFSPISDLATEDAPPSGRNSTDCLRFFPRTPSAMMEIVDTDSPEAQLT